MRKPIIVGNWKMNNGPEKAHSFYHELANLIDNQDELAERVEWAIAAPAPSWAAMVGHSHNEEEEVLYLPIGAQNVNENESGAYTGEISVSMLQEWEIDYVIIGHSERREYYGETNESVNAKLKAVVKTFADQETFIVPIVAFGETKEQFEAGQQEEVIRTQLEAGIKDLSADEVKDIVLAYEPIWAIGTGLTATPEQAQAACAFSRKIVEEMYGPEAAAEVRIQYGGSMNPGNIKELMAQPDIDGGLVGGASLEASSFFELLSFNK